MMNIECNKCHANNQVGEVFVECVNCRENLSDLYLQARKKQGFWKNLLKIFAAAIILMVIILPVYELGLRDKIFPQTSRHTINREYTAISGCMENIKTHSGYTEEALSICTEALEKLQRENPNEKEIKPRMLDGYAQVILSKK